MPQTAQMRLGLFATHAGHHIAAWRHPSSEVNNGASPLQRQLRLARAAERGKFDAFFLADGSSTPNLPAEIMSRGTRGAMLEPSTLLAALSQVTSRIGLVATSSSTYDQPFHVAHKFMTLDHMSGGRAGWNLVTGVSATEALNFNQPAQMSHADRYARADAFADAVLALWEHRGVSPGAARDRVYADRFFQVRGPLPLAPSPQGRPVLIQAGGSEAGRELAARTAEMIYSVAPDLAEGQAYYRDVKGRMAKYGRDPDQLKIMPGVFPIVGRTMQEAEDKYGELQALVDPDVAIAQLALAMGSPDLVNHPLDGPLPDDLESNCGTTHLRILIGIARAKNLTLRQLSIEVAGGYGHWQVRGTAQHIADQLEERFKAKAADGFNIMPATLPGGIDDFVDLVVPELQRRGLMRTEYAGTTLRDHLGLNRPIWRGEPAEPARAYA